MVRLLVAWLGGAGDAQGWGMQVDGLRGVLDPFWGGAVGFILVIGMAETSAVVSAYAGARQAATRLGINSTGVVIIVCSSLPLLKKENGFHLAPLSRFAKAYI